MNLQKVLLTPVFKLYDVKVTSMLNVIGPIKYSNNVVLVLAESPGPFSGMNFSPLDPPPFKKILTFLGLDAPLPNSVHALRGQY